MQLLAERETATTANVRHYALVYPQEFKVKPDAQKDVGKIHNFFKRNPYPMPYTLTEIVEAFCSGQTLMLSMVELDLKNAADKEKASALNTRSGEWANLHTLRFKSTQLLGIDIDDTYNETDVQTVLAHFKGRVSAAYYSFSHGRENDRGGTENRYRLLFQLDTPLTEYEVGKEIVKIIRDELAELYPNFSADKIDIMQPKTLWHGSNRLPIFIDESAFLNTDFYTAKVELILQIKRESLKARRKDAAKDFRSRTNNPVIFSELVEMANVIGHIPSGSDEFEKWRDLTLSIRSHEVEGQISEDEGLQLFNIISGGESDESAYFNFKPNGNMTIGTFIKYATDAGFKRKHKYGHALQETQESIEKELIRVKGHIPVEVAKELLQRKQRILVSSPTGSGKTTSFINAFKEISNQDYHFYIFSAPTIALTEQIAAEHQVPCITGGMANLRHDVTNKAIAGQRVFVATFDKTAELVSHLENGIDYGSNPRAEYTIVVDEIHKYTEAYNYRFAAIDNLETLSNVAASLIGLSGTVEDILKDGFDKLIEIDNGNKKSPCLDYRVFTYDTNENGIITAENADVMLIPVIRGLLQQTRVLLFINNKERIKRIARLLKKEGIAYQTVSSDNRKSATYTKVVESGEIEDGVQVVLTTTVLADGISIKNKLDWSCVVVADRASQIFNPSTIKQISNRFRNDYRYFALYMRTPNPDYAEVTRFNVESDYRYKLNTVNRYVDYLNTEFENELLKDFIPSTVEKHNGIYYRSKDEDAKIEFNPLFVRHQSMRNKERYYATYRNAFIGEVGRVLGHKPTGVFNVNDEIRKNGSDLSGLLADLQVEKVEKKLESDELRANFSLYFDESIYGCFVRGDEDALKHFKDDVHPDQYAATWKNSRIADFETCKAVGEALKNRVDINKYVDDIRALTDIAAFDYVKKVTVTKRVFRELLKLDLKTYPSADFKGIIEDDLPKKLKVTKKDVKEGLKLFHKFSSKTGGVAYATIRPLSLELVAKVRHGVEQEAIKGSLLKYIGTRPEQQQKVLYPAVSEKWGIEWYEDDFL